jgi:hypothetical protein
LPTPEWWTAPSTSITMAQILHQSENSFKSFKHYAHKI